MKKIIIGVLVIIEIFSLYMMYQSNENKKLNEVNIKDNKINKNTFAIYWDETGTGEYKEYTNESWPGKGYALDLDNTECMSEEGNKLNNDIIEYNSENNSLTLTSKSTAYCTLYFFLAEKKYDYTGNYQVFIAPKTGNYKIELWGASGEVDIGKVDTQGRGAYTKGTIHLNKNDNLYVYVGQIGIYGEFSFNGGGPGELSGGGATDVRLNIYDTGNWNNFESLKSRIMVAAGGGGGANHKGIDYTQEYQRGDGGALKGLDARFCALYSDHCTYDYSGHGATQTSGGKPGQIFADAIDPVETSEMTGKFGKGGYGIHASNSSFTSSGGGGGYYGGGHGNHPGYAWTGGGGGSSYISGHEGCVAISEESTEDKVQPKAGCTDGTKDINCSYHYSNKIFTETEMKAGNETMPTHDGLGTMTGNTGNGYAKITFVN